jgi:hypothetical protein
MTSQFLKSLPDALDDEVDCAYAILAAFIGLREIECRDVDSGRFGIERLLQQHAERLADIKDGLEKLQEAAAGGAAGCRPA